MQCGSGRFPWCGGAFRRAAALLACAVVPLLSGCATHFLRRHAERRINHKLEDLIGPADEYTVRIRDTPDAEIVAGRIRCIDIDGRNVLAGHQIELESVHLELHDLHYHPPPDEAWSVGQSVLVIQLTQQALNDYLRRQNPAAPPEIVLAVGTVTLKGSLELLGVPTPLVTTGHLEIMDGTRLNFRADTVRLSGDPIPGIGPEYVEGHLNPLLNVKRLHLPLRLEAVETEPGRLVVRGRVFLPPTPRSR